MPINRLQDIMKIKGVKLPMWAIFLLLVGICGAALKPNASENSLVPTADYAKGRLPDRVLFGVIGSLLTDGLIGERSNLSPSNKKHSD